MNINAFTENLNNKAVITYPPIQTTTENITVDEQHIYHLLNVTNTYKSLDSRDIPAFDFTNNHLCDVQTSERHYTHYSSSQ